MARKLAITDARVGDRDAREIAGNRINVGDAGRARTGATAEDDDGRIDVAGAAGHGDGVAMPLPVGRQERRGDGYGNAAVINDRSALIDIGIGKVRHEGRGTDGAIDLERAAIEIQITVSSAFEDQVVGERTTEQIHDARATGVVLPNLQAGRICWSAGTGSDRKGSVRQPRSRKS